ncbi:MAG TPA: nitroreductase [Dehalococcoidia bacterium]|nr:nitroreductase [Dehalococcoidia bacterium]
MDVFSAIKERRSIRSYKPDKIPKETMNKLLEAMRLAPSGGNRQPYRFIIVQDNDMKEKLAAACRWFPGRPQGQAFIAEAPVVIVACGSEGSAVVRYYREEGVSLTIGRNVPEEIDKSSTDFQSCMDIDLAIALDHLTLVAAEEGLGTCWIAALDEREIKRLLAVPDDRRVLVVMPIGYTDSWPEPRPRKPLERIICYDKYG